MSLMLIPSMGLTERSSSKDKENKLNNLLQDAKYSKWIPFLNPVFNVNFEMSRDQLRIPLQEKKKGIETMLLGLFQMVRITSEIIVLFKMNGYKKMTSLIMDIK